jgi:hypothetical protein
MCMQKHLQDTSRIMSQNFASILQSRTPNPTNNGESILQHPACAPALRLPARPLTARARLTRSRYRSEFCDRSPPELRPPVQCRPLRQERPHQPVVPQQQPDGQGVAAILHGGDDQGLQRVAVEGEDATPPRERQDVVLAERVRHHLLRRERDARAENKHFHTHPGW